jgi:hypothetical protein
MSSIDAKTSDPRTMTLANKAIGDPTEAAEPDRAAAQPNRRRIAANFIALASTSVLGLIVTILISIYVRRALGPAAIGQLSWALAAIAYLGVCQSRTDRRLPARAGENLRGGRNCWYHSDPADGPCHHRYGLVGRSRSLICAGPPSTSFCLSRA